MSELIGQTIGSYRLIEQIGQGGMATVYRADDLRLERVVAVKVIRKEMIMPDMLTQTMRRFEREARSLAKLEHPNIVRVYEYGEHDGAPYLAMQFVTGGVLAHMTGEAVAWDKAVRLLIPVANALEYAHQQGIIHRDIKPSNILMVGQDEAVISDFGVAKVLGSAETTQLTESGMGVGTPEYMAPEQWEGKAVPQTDIYALGVVLYELITGQKPYEADTPAAMLHKQLVEPLTRPKEIVKDLPEEVEAVLVRALEKQPEKRYESMGDFAKALEALGRDAGSEAAHKAATVRTAWSDAALEKSQLPTMATPIPGAKSTQRGQRKGISPAVAAGLGAVGMLFVVGVIVGIVLLVRGLASRADAGLGDEAALTDTGLPQTADPVEETQPAAIGNQTATNTFTPTITIAATNTLIPEPTLTLTLGTGSMRTSEEDGMVMVYIPAGEFLMGVNDKNIQSSIQDCLDGGRTTEECEGNAWNNWGAEYPEHAVYLDAFWIDQIEVTNAMYAACVEAEACKSPLDSSTHPRNSSPVSRIDWYMADAYCKWVGRRLPTEAEWEKAVQGNYAIDDMLSSVGEWTVDWYSGVYYANSPYENPTGPATGQYKVMRGGGTGIINYSPSVKSRYPADPNDGTFGERGIRCVLPVEEVD